MLLPGKPFSARVWLFSYGAPVFNILQNSLHFDFFFFGQF